MVYTTVYHGLPWCTIGLGFTMVYHGIPCTMYNGISLIYHGIHHGIPWYSMVYHVYHTMVYYGTPWIPWYMVHHGIPCFTIVYYGIPQYDCDVLWHCRTMIPWYYIMVRQWHNTSQSYCGVPWYDRYMLRHGRTMVLHGITMCTMVNHGRPRGITTWSYHGNTMWCTMVQPYHGMVRGITITQNTCYSLLRSVSSIATIVGLCIQQACGSGSQ